MLRFDEDLIAVGSELANEAVEQGRDVLFADRGRDYRPYASSRTEKP